MTEPLVKPVTCRGCGGKGYIILASGSIGHHFICDGTGQVESDRKTIAATKARIAHRGRIISSLQDLATKENRYRISHAIDGFDMLGRMEPARAAKAEASIFAGRPDVLLALADYYVEHRDQDRAEREAEQAAKASAKTSETSVNETDSSTNTEA
jgi:hypothetical protein